MTDFKFTIKHKDNKSNARTGIIRTRHGTIRTPAFVPVGTAATVKSLTPNEIKDSNIDVFFVNTYHMLFRPGIEIVKKSGGLHTFMDWHGPVMTDSAGFQAFSLGEYGNRKVKPQNHPGSGRPQTRTSSVRGKLSPSKYRKAMPAPYALSYGDSPGVKKPEPRIVKN